MKKLVHRTGNWLALTNTWLYNLIIYSQSEYYKSYAVCKKVTNWETFPYESLIEIPGFSFWEKIGLRIGWTKEQYIIRKFRVIAQNLQPDLWHSHFGVRGWQDVEVLKKMDTTHVVSFYGYDVNIGIQQKKWKARYNQLFESVDMVLCEGPFMRSTIINELGCPEEKVQIQRLGIEIQKISFQLRSIEKDQGIKFLMAASFKPKKGLPDGLKALGELKKVYSDFEVTIIGEANPHLEASVAEKKKMRQVINDYELKDQVSWKGFMPHEEMLKTAYEHDIFLSPSKIAPNGDREGGAPIGMIEMAATGMPVLSTTHCDIPFVLGEKNQQLLVEEGDIVGLKQNMLKLIHGEVDSKIVAKDNRAFIEKNLDVKKCGQALAEKYKKLLKHHG